MSRLEPRGSVVASFCAFVATVSVATIASGLLGVSGAEAQSSPAAATTTTTTQPATPSPSPSASSAPSSGSSGSSGSNASSSNLGGYETTATGSGVTWSYEQPNFPVPAEPTLEAHLGYSSATFNAGPTGEAIASTLWPGSVAASGGQQLSLLLQPYLGNSASNLPAPAWPVQAASTYPPGPGAPSSASQDAPGVTMQSSSTQTAGTATSGFDGSALGASGFISIQSSESSVESTVEGGHAVSQATSEVHGISIAGGLVTIGQVTSTATSTSDGNQAQVDGTSTASQVSVGGQAAVLDSNGLQLVGENVPLPGSLLPSVQKELQTAGVQVALTNPTDSIDGASGQRELDGVQIRIDLTTLDKEADQLVASLPQQLQQQVIDQLPLAPPDSQVITVDLGQVDVAAAASPAFDASVSSPGSDAAGLATGASGLDTGVGASDFGSPTTPGATGTDLGAGPDTSPAGAGALPTGFSPATSAAPATLFKGIGGGLMGLGLILALLLAGVLWRADKAVGALTARAPCVGERATDL